MHVLPTHSQSKNHLGNFVLLELIPIQRLLERKEKRNNSRRLATHYKLHPPSVHDLI